jgi:hypothetical protein
VAQIFYDDHIPLTLPREAFGQPVGAFQAIQYLWANMVNATLSLV